jgi:prepilin signal peptidase PulO-like enzyme (type II secretory pathway)
MQVSVQIATTLFSVRYAEWFAGTKAASPRCVAAQLRRIRDEYPTNGTGMADKRALGMIGLMLGAATVFVTVISAVVVGSYVGQLDGRNGVQMIARLPTATRWARCPNIP